MAIYSGQLIVVEGVDGVGKTSQCQLLEAYLLAEGYKVYLTRQPGGTKLGSTFRGLLKSGELKNPLTELFLFLADRAEHHLEILEKLKQGYTVILDRYYYSTLAYQWARKEIRDALGHISQLKVLNMLAVDYLEPDIVIYLKLSIEEIQSRFKSRKEIQNIDKDHFEEKEYLSLVKDNYESILDSLNIAIGVKVLIVNANQDKDTIFNEITNFIQFKLPAKPVEVNLANIN